MPPSSTPSAFSLESSTYRGKADALMASGAAEPFIQPWYTPIACTPRDTGMPMGGIGSAFTLTPAGTTPLFSGLGGLHVTPAPGETMALHSFFFAERAANAPLLVRDATSILRRNRFAPLTDPEGKAYLHGSESPSQVAEAVARMAAHPRLYEDNEAALKRWRIELSPRTREALAGGPSPLLSRSLLLDLFGHALELQNRYASSLTGDSEGPSISGQSAYPAGEMDYVGLYPLARTAYADKGHALTLEKTTYTPMICGDELWCSLPVSGTSFSIHNPTGQALEATVVFTLENLVGDAVIKARPGVQDAWFHRIRAAHYQTGEVVQKSLGGNRQAFGMALSQEKGQRSGDFRGRVSVLVETPQAESQWGFWATATPNAYAQGEASLIAEALGTGRLQAGGEAPLATGRERRMGALCVTVALPPGARRHIHFAMALDFPDIALRGFHSHKKYTRFFPAADLRAEIMAADLLRDRESVWERVAADHASMAHLGDLPALLAKGKPGAGPRLLTQLANTLGFLADATVWDTADRFWIRECADYPFFNSLDVYFYGSFSVLRLLPRLDGCVLREFALAILSEDPRTRRHWEYMFEPHADLPEERLEGPRGVRGAVPHDMGSPFDPAPDAYIWHNVKHWKDLAPKYLLLLWRHFQVTGDAALLRECWPAARAALAYLEAMRDPSHPLPMTGGTDDTFDNLESRGISIYCGSLWVAALSAGEAMAGTLGEKAEAKLWHGLAEVARPAVTEALWDEKDGYYHFWSDPRDGGRSDDVFADQLLADLWLRLLKLPALTPDAKARRAAQAVVDRNYRRNSPWIGAANLVAREGGTLEAFQAQDVWLGVQYSLAAACANLGLAEEAWDILEVSYRNLYDMARIPFGAPEGFNGSVPLTAKRLVSSLGLTPEAAEAWMGKLKAAGFLGSDGRCKAMSRLGYAEFAAKLSPLADTGLKNQSEDLIPHLHALLQSHALQYTAGRYLRPGMLWALVGVG